MTDFGVMPSMPVGRTSAHAAMKPDSSSTANSVFAMLRLARDAEERGVPGHGVDQLLRVALLLEQLQRLARVPGAEVGVALVVEVVEQPGDGAQLLVLAALARVGAHRGLHAEHVLAQRLGLGPLARRAPRPRRVREATRCRVSGRRPEPALQMPFDTLGRRFEPGIRTDPRMEKFVIEGGAPLSGTLVPAGNKNAALPALAASLLTSEEVVLRNVPRIRDVEAMVELLRAPRRDAPSGATRTWWRSWPTRSRHTHVDAALAERIRASFLLAGPLLARFGQADMPPPGGDVIGRRRLDPHLDAFRALGAEVRTGPLLRAVAPPTACTPATSSWTSPRSWPPRTR